MDAAHLHLILNHFPIAGMLFSPPLLIASWLFKSEHLKRAGLVAIFLTGLFTTTTFLTGRPTEELVEHLPGISGQLIKAHEEAAEKALMSVCVAGFAALVALFFSLKRKSVPSWALPLVTVLALVSVGLLAWTNNLGGKVRHSEIRSGAPSANP